MTARSQHMRCAASTSIIGNDGLRKLPDTGAQAHQSQCQRVHKSRSSTSESVSASPQESVKHIRVSVSESTRVGQVKHIRVSVSESARVGQAHQSQCQRVHKSRSSQAHQSQCQRVHKSRSSTSESVSVSPQESVKSLRKTEPR